MADHSRRYAFAYVELVTSQEFAFWNWSWPGLHQPLHALMTLIDDADPKSQSPNADLSRQAVDELFALCGPEGGVVSADRNYVGARPLTEGGFEAWELLADLRALTRSRAPCLASAGGFRCEGRDSIGSGAGMSRELR